MGYSVKWVLENLGVTRDALRYYEKEGLISVKKTRNEVNNYRDYNEEDIERIWAIKLLIHIGFTAKEIKKFMVDANFDFETAMEKKVEELEKRQEENAAYIEFAKSIKFAGRIPTVSKVGSMHFDDFSEYARKDWNFFDAPEKILLMKYTNEISSKETRDITSEDVENMIKVLGNIDAEELKHTYVLDGYYRVISDMQELEYDNEIVQRVVQLLCKYWASNNLGKELQKNIAPKLIAKYMASFFLYGDVALLNERNHGREGCNFIAQALAYYSECGNDVL